LSRLANYFPERFSAYAFVDVGYYPPGQNLTAAAIQQINSTAQAKLGFALFGYFLLMNDEDGPKLLDEHVGFIQPLQEF
jgi:soluble epoxide hydrolase/lipid-phosphate phosphatase